jgi:hypothetical protein
VETGGRKEKTVRVESASSFVYASTRKRVEIGGPWQIDPWRATVPGNFHIATSWGIIHFASVPCLNSLHPSICDRPPFKIFGLPALGRSGPR